MQKESDLCLNVCNVIVGVLGLNTETRRHGDFNFNLKPLRLRVSVFPNRKS